MGLVCHVGRSWLDRSGGWGVELICRNGWFSAAVLPGLQLGVPPHGDLARGWVWDPALSGVVQFLHLVGKPRTVGVLLVVDFARGVCNYALCVVFVWVGNSLISDV